MVLWGVALFLVLSGKTNPGLIVSFPSCTVHIGEYTSEQDIAMHRLVQTVPTCRLSKCEIFDQHICIFIAHMIAYRYEHKEKQKTDLACT